MSAPRRLLDNAAVAAALGVKPSWWRRHKRRLYDAGFPRPVPGFERLCLHDPAAIGRWLDAQHAILAALDAAVDKQDWPRTLDRRAHALLH